MPLSNLPYVRPSICLYVYLYLRIRPGLLVNGEIKHIIFSYGIAHLIHDSLSPSSLLSSLSSQEGATTEHGPLVLYDIKEACSSGDCDYTKQLSNNPYAWNAHANVL